MIRDMNICVYVCLSVDRFCKYNNITNMQDAVMKLYKCVVEIKIKAEFKDGCVMIHEQVEYDHSLLRHV